MSSVVVTAGAAAVALYVYMKQRQASDALGEEGGTAATAPPTMEACRDVERPPTTWMESLYYFKEVLRYMYHETFARWHTVDLFVGLAYLSHRASPEYPAADLVAQAQPISLELPSPSNRVLLDELREVRRYMLCCRGLRLRRPDLQAKYWKEQLGLEADQILMQEATAQLMRPAYVVIADKELQSLVVCVRGTQSLKDLFTSLTAPTKPHHMMQQDTVLLGYSHLGMLAAARWLSKQIYKGLQAAMQQYPDYKLRIVGHSMGAGTAVMLTMMLRDILPPTFLAAHCYAIACPACMTLELATSCREYVTAVINGTDIVPTFSTASVDTLRDEVTQSSWFAEFQRDLRSSVYRAVQGGIRGMGSATSWTTRSVLMSASVPFRACYVRRSPSTSCAPALLSGGGRGETQLLDSTTSGSGCDSGDMSPLQRLSADPADHGRDDGRDLKRSPSNSLPLSSSPLQESVMQETLQSCLYAVGAAVHPHHHHHHHHAHHPDGASTQGSPMQDGLMASRDHVMMPPGERDPNAPPAVSTATVQQLRRRIMWPWSSAAVPPDGTAAPSSSGAPAGGSGGAGGDAEGADVAGASQMDEDDERKPEATGRVPGGGANSPWRQALGQRMGQTRVAAQRAGDWLFAGMFKQCTAPRRYTPLQPGDVAEDGLRYLTGPHGADGGDSGVGGTRVSGSGTRGGPSGGDGSSDDDEDDVDEEEAMLREEEAMLQSGRGRHHHRALSHEELQCSLQAGITAVVAAVSNEAGNGDAPTSPSLEDMGLDVEGSGLSMPPTSAAAAAAAVAAVAAHRAALGSTSGFASRGYPVESAAAAAAAAASGSSAAAAAATRGAGAPPAVAAAAASSSSLAPRQHWLYPAGRILHFFPANAMLHPDRDGRGGAASLDPLSDAGGAFTSRPDLGPEIAAPLPFAPMDTSASGAAAPTASASAALLPYSVCHMPHNEAYGRIRLCKTMVADHMIPAYLVALDSVVSQLEAVLEPTDEPQQPTPLVSLPH